MVLHLSPKLHHWTVAKYLLLLLHRYLLLLICYFTLCSAISRLLLLLALCALPRAASCWLCSYYACLYLHYILDMIIRDIDIVCCSVYYCVKLLLCVDYEGNSNLSSDNTMKESKVISSHHQQLFSLASFFVFSEETLPN